MNNHRFVRAYPPASPPPGPSLWAVFRDGDIVMREETGGLRLLRNGDLPQSWADEPSVYLGTLDGQACLAIEIAAETPLPSSAEAVSLRALYGRTSDIEYSLAGYATQLLYWRKTSRFCPVCGHATEQAHRDWGRHCPNCGHTGYPRVSPATLILVSDGDKVLLATKPGWGERYSILAGFVEPGETLEECVERETLEEAGLGVTGFKYAGSQTWPFPHQLMIGFTCRYAGGEIRLDDEELAHAAWFTRDNLPMLPPALSLSRQMIDRWVNGDA